jgi:GNAT superfamily N-acetyltransferase
MNIQPLDPGNTELILACHQAYLAAHQADRPGEGYLGPAAFRHMVTVGWQPSVRQEPWLATNSDGSITGWYILYLPERENQHRASLNLTVDPMWRRRGTGNALLRHATERAVSDGRTTLTGTAVDGGSGEFFARAAGASPGLIDQCRVQDLTTLPPLATLRADTKRAAAGYSTVSWTGPVPEQYLDGAAAVFNAFGDAPHDAGYQPSQWTAQRVREELNESRSRTPDKNFVVAALCDQTAEMAAMTEVFTDPEVREWGSQGVTAVARDHRGHRLGLLVKLAMLDLLTEEAPDLKRIQTWNAAVNEHMLAVNEILGYTPAGPPHTRWRLDVG